MRNTYFEPDSIYYSSLRMPLLVMARDQPKKVLEIGCASGHSLAYFKQQGSELVVGVEIFPEVAKIARDRTDIDDVIVGNIEEIELNYPEGYFDMIVASHVLEHVTDPWMVLGKIIKYLKPGGQLIGSLPNVRYIGVSLPLLFMGNWKYQDAGILDITHFRFFTLSTIKELLLSADLEVDSITPEVSGKKHTIANVATLGLCKHLLGYTNNFSATKPIKLTSPNL
jgi:SAM-dependent methyltransferase